MPAPRHVPAPSLTPAADACYTRRVRVWSNLAGMRGGRRLSVILFAAILPGMAFAQSSPLGSEFQVNTYTTRNQYMAAVATDPSGGFVVVWTSYRQDGSDFGVFGQRFASSGAPLGSEFQINTYATNSQRRPGVATDPSGGFVVVWASTTQDGDDSGIFGQRFASSGARLGSEFQVNTYTTAAQYYPVVATDPSGGFVVVWQSYWQDGDSVGVFGQRFTSSGAALGSEFQVNTYTTSGQSRPAVATDPSGDFVVVWASYRQDGDNLGVFGQRFASSGAGLGSEFQVNTYTTAAQYYPVVATDPSGGFVVVWASFTQDGYNLGVFGRRFTSSGAAVGSEFQVNTHTTSQQSRPAVAADPSGGFVVVWQSLFQDGYGYGVFGQRFASSGAALGSEFQVNTYTTNDQSFPVVAADPSGGFVVVWASVPQDGNGFGVFAQRYGVRPASPSVPVPAWSRASLLLTLCLLGGFGVMRLRRRKI